MPPNGYKGWKSCGCERCCFVPPSYNRTAKYRQLMSFPWHHNEHGLGSRFDQEHEHNDRCDVVGMGVAFFLATRMNIENRRKSSVDTLATTSALHCAKHIACYGSTLHVRGVCNEQPSMLITNWPSMAAPCRAALTATGKVVCKVLGRLARTSVSRHRQKTDLSSDSAHRTCKPAVKASNQKLNSDWKRFEQV